MRKFLGTKSSIFAGTGLAILFALFFYLAITGIAPIIHPPNTELVRLDMQTRIILGILAFFSIFGSVLILFTGVENQ